MPLQINETFEVFRSACTYKREYTLCSHEQTELGKCLPEKKYCPRVYIKPVKKVLPIWYKNDVEWQNLVHQGYIDLISDTLWVSDLQSKQPTLDVRATLQKIYAYVTDTEREKPYRSYMIKRKTVTPNWKQVYCKLIELGYNNVVAKESTGGGFNF